MDKRMVVVFFPLLLASLWNAVSHAGEPPAGDRVSFRVEAGREVENDRMTVVVQAQAEARDVARLADALNRDMEWALEQARAVPAVTPSTQAYRTYPVYENKRITRWRASQSLRLESTDVEALSALAGRLQERLQIQSMQFSVSPQRRAEVEDELIAEGLRAFSRRAAMIASNLNAAGYRLLDVNIGGAGRPPVVPVRLESSARVTAAAVAPPAVEQGSSRISVQVSGSILLTRGRAGALSDPGSR